MTDIITKLLTAYNAIKGISDKKTEWLIVLLVAADLITQYVK